MKIIATVCVLTLIKTGSCWTQESATVDVPKWVGEEIPFDADRYFTLPKNNSAPFYELAFAEFSSQMHWQNPETQQAESICEREAQFAKVYELFQTDPDLVEPAEIDRVLESYKKGLALLRIAQQQPECAFPIKIRGIDTIVITTHLRAAREVQQVLHLKSFRDQQLGDIDAAIEGLAIQLRLARDLRPRGDATAQLTACLLEHSESGSF